VSSAAEHTSASWRSHQWSAGGGNSRLAINQFQQQDLVDEASVDRFLAGREIPIVEDRHCTFVFRGEADEVFLAQRILGLPGRLPMRRVAETTLWYLVLKVPQKSRINYQIEVRRADHVERFNDPLNPKLSHSPFGAMSVCFTLGYTDPEWTFPDPEAPPGELTEFVVASPALERECPVTLYLPAGFRRTASYPLLVVHDGGEFLQYAAAKAVLDNLIHRGEIVPTIAAFLHPKDRLVEYANSPAHARFLTNELLPHLQTEFPVVANRSGRILLGASFGAIASLSTAYASPQMYGSLVLMSGSFVFADAGTDHGGGPVFDPVVQFVNRYREQPRRVAERLFVSCGLYEPLIIPNRSIVPIFESTGMRVRYVEARDGHTWENWRDRLRDALLWVARGRTSAPSDSPDRSK
jgi:enterochelin esterase-like enzyme